MSVVLFGAGNMGYAILLSLRAQDPAREIRVADTQPEARARAEATGARVYATPREALAVLIELNNKYAVDGRDPNSYSGIFWVLGRFDRPWAPERPIFGTIRWMSSDNTARKLNVKSAREGSYR